ncbi:MAG: tetratricopeptide repeat protein [Chlamydiae bacterium]|nr:tetratricopeptide repeat protein [Chlamydiota bacterium]
MKRFFFALIIITSTFLLADSKPASKYLYPDMYSFPFYNCRDHLYEDPFGSSSYELKNGKPVLEFKINLEGNKEHTLFYADPKLLERVSSLAYLIPINKNSRCLYQFCNECKSPVARKVIYYDDFNAERYDYEELDISGYACHCLNRWYEVEEWQGGIDIIQEDKKKAERVKAAYWVPCRNSTIENCYFQWHNQSYFHFFEQFLSYNAQNHECTCYWPQINQKAMQVSDIVHKHLVRLEVLPSIFQMTSEFPFISRNPWSEFPPNHRWGSQHIVVQGLFVHAFFYSHYRQIFLDLCKYVDMYPLLIHGHAPRSEVEAIIFESKSIQILDACYEALDKIKPLLLTMYDECLEKHPHPKILYERGMVHMHLGDAASSLSDIRDLIDFQEKNNQALLTSEIYHQEGTAYADLGMYDEALASLNKAIEKDPKNKEAYFDRAEAYFETGDFEQSLKDYLDSGLKPTPINKEIDVNFYEFSLGFAPKVIVGAADSTVDFIPSLFNSASSLGRATWAFAGDPLQTSKDFVRAVHSCIEFIKSSSALETIGIIAPEIKDLVKSWDKLKDRERGEKVGYIVGKYGVEIFIGGGIAKGVKAFRDLKRANNLLNFESMALSQRNAAMIVSKTNEANTKAVAAWERALLAKGGVVTQANSTIGWKVGQDICNLTKQGKIPKWSAVRQRYWKNEAHFRPEKYKPENLERMKKGLAPQRKNKITGQMESMELHHIPSQKDGGLFDVIEVWPDEHALIDKNRHTGR